jgi:hypothetical protein
VGESHKPTSPTSPARCASTTAVRENRSELSWMTEMTSVLIIDVDARVHIRPIIDTRSFRSSAPSRATTSRDSYCPSLASQPICFLRSRDIIQQLSCRSNRHLAMTDGYS